MTSDVTRARGFTLATALIVAGCGAAELPPVDATRPSQDSRILEASPTMSDGSGIPQHRTETVESTLELRSGGLVGGMSVDAAGNVYTANFQESVWRISPDGEAGLLSDEFTSASGNLSLPNGDLLQGEWTDNQIYRIHPDGTRTLFAEGGLDGPVGMVRLPSGDILVANSRGEYLARVPAEGGQAEVVLRHELMTQPNGVALDDDGNIYVSDLDGGNVFRWTPGGEVEIVAELPGRGNAHAAFAGGALYVNKIWDHVIYRVDLETGAYGIVTGNGHPGYDDGATGVATIEEPNGIAVTPERDVIYFNTHRGIMGVGNEGRIVLRRLVLPR